MELDLIINFMNVTIGFDALYERGMRVINEGEYRNSSIDFDFASILN